MLRAVGRSRHGLTQAARPVVQQTPAAMRGTRGVRSVQMESTTALTVFRFFRDPSRARTVLLVLAFIPPAPVPVGPALLFSLSSILAGFCFGAMGFRVGFPHHVLAAGLRPILAESGPVTGLLGLSRGTRRIGALPGVCTRPRVLRASGSLRFGHVRHETLDIGLFHEVSKPRLAVLERVAQSRPKLAVRSELRAGLGALRQALALDTFALSASLERPLADRGPNADSSEQARDGLGQGRARHGVTLGGVVTPAQASGVDPAGTVPA